MNIFDQIDIYSRFLPKITNNLINFLFTIQIAYFNEKKIFQSYTKLFEKRNNTEYFIKNSLGKLFCIVSFKTSDAKCYIAFTEFSSAFRFA